MALARDVVEARLQRRQIDAYIRAEPVAIVLHRPTWVQTLAGGRTPGPDLDLPEQMFRLVPFKRRLTHGALDKPEGQIIDLSYVLVGYADADVQPLDWFEHSGGKYDVVFIEPNRSYRTACDITYRGSEEG